MAVSSGRALRPGAHGIALIAEGEEGEGSCPFCQGSEHETPPESFALRPRELPADGPGWTVRVVPNRYPAIDEPAGRQEVVVHGPSHARTIADLGEASIDAVAEAWRSRAEAARTAGYRYVHAFLNEGRAAGASLAHSHSQLAWLAEPPPVVARERRTGACGACQVIAGSRDSVVIERDGLLALCPSAGRAPYELLIAPAGCRPDLYSDDLLAPALRLLAESVGILRAHLGPVALNAWAHSAPWPARGGHWHIELVPRTAVAAGLELGAGIYVNPLPPEVAAERLRGVAGA